MKDILELIKKSGNITPESVALGGVLGIEEARSMVQLIFDKSDFLTQVTNKAMSKLNQRITAYDLARGQLVRVPSGANPTDAQRRQLETLGCYLEAKDAQLFVQVLRDTIVDNKNNPNFLDELQSNFAKSFGNDIVYLGFVGDGDDYAGDAFEKLNKGWLQLILESADSAKHSYAADDSWVTRLEALLANLHEDASGRSSIIMNSKDFDSYVIELGKDNRAVQILTDGGKKSFMGYPIIARSEMPAGKLLATPMKNLVIGIANQVERNRYYDVEARSVKYVFDMYFDYGVVAPKLCSYAEEIVP